MGKSNSHKFTEEQNRLASMAKVLAHPARIAILEYLMEKGTCVCGDIVDEIPLSQSTISQHLKEMKKAGIIKGSIEGTFTCYCLDGQKCLSIRNTFMALFTKVMKCC